MAGFVSCGKETGNIGHWGGIALAGTGGLGVLRGGDDVTDDYGDDTHVPDFSTG